MPYGNLMPDNGGGGTLEILRKEATRPISIPKN